MNTKRMDILLEDLIKYPKETEWIEFKVNNSNPEMIGENISALANGASLKDKPFGYLVFGVEDNTHEIIGTNFNPLIIKKGNEEFENWIAQRLSPRIDFEINMFDYFDKQIVIFKIPATKFEPVKFTNVAYIRIGSITRKLQDFPEKERKIWKKVENIDFENEIALRNIQDEKVLELLDYSAYFELTGQKMPFNQNAILEKFIQEEFIEKPDNLFNIKNLGAILFAKNLENFDNLHRKVVRVIIYKGKGRLETIREHQNKKGYAIGFDELVNYVNDQLPAPKFQGDSLFTRVYLYAPQLLRNMDRMDKIRATYQHCCLKYVIDEFMTNQTLRERFNVDEKNYPMISKIIKETIENGMIKEFDTENKAKRYTKYIPFWA